MKKFLRCFLLFAVVLSITVFITVMLTEKFDIVICIMGLIFISLLLDMYIGVCTYNKKVEEDLEDQGEEDEKGEVR